jgi:hypothetical protein
MTLCSGEQDAEPHFALFKTCCPITTGVIQNDPLALHDLREAKEEKPLLFYFLHISLQFPENGCGCDYVRLFTKIPRLE